MFRYLMSVEIDSLQKVQYWTINTRFIWYHEKYGTLDKSQCGFRKHRSTSDHQVSLERYVRDAFARKQQAVGLFFDLEKAYDTTWQYGVICDLHTLTQCSACTRLRVTTLRTEPLQHVFGNCNFPLFSENK